LEEPHPDQVVAVVAAAAVLPQESFQSLNLP
jgi:hypothetical protein